MIGLLIAFVWFLALVQVALVVFLGALVWIGNCLRPGPRRGLNDLRASRAELADRLESERLSLEAREEQFERIERASARLERLAEQIEGRTE